jgi:hypothetical protein
MTKLAPKPRAMDGVLTQVVRQLRTDVGPQPFVTPYGLVMQATNGNAPDPKLSILDAERLTRRRELKQDRIVALAERRRITLAEAWAASDIRDVVEWRAGAHAAYARAQFRERQTSSVYEPGEDAVWFSLLEAEHTRYLPWKEWAEAQRIATGGATLEGLTQAVAVEGLGLSQAEREMRIRKDGRVIALLRHSLHFYAVLAGRQAGDEPPTIEGA